MSDIKLPEGAPEEVITAAHVREIDLTPFGAKGTLSLITLDNAMDHNRPNTFGPASLAALNEAITISDRFKEPVTSNTQTIVRPIETS